MGNTSGDATLSNTGASDSLEVFSIYGRTGMSRELGRILLRFPAEQIIADIASGLIPTGAQYFLRMFNVQSEFTVPSNFDLEVRDLTSPFEEGTGLDLDNYSDLGTSNWINRDETNTWTTVGGDFSSTVIDSQTFVEGLEDLELDITSSVSAWLSDASLHNGYVVKLSNNIESVSTQTYFTKRFSGKTSEFVIKRPVIEVRFDDSTKDDRAKFKKKSPFLPATDSRNQNTIYLRPLINGEPVDIDGNPTYIPSLRFWKDEDKENPIVPDFISVTREEEGVYKAVVVFSTAEEEIFEEWYDLIDTNRIYKFGKIDFINPDNAENNKTDYVASICNLKSEYSSQENAFFTVLTQIKKRCKSSYLVMQKEIALDVPEDVRFRLTRVEDNLLIFDYSEFTRLSYDESGLCFSLDMSMLEQGFSYRIDLARFYDGNLQEIKSNFRFRVRQES